MTRECELKPLGELRLLDDKSFRAFVACCCVLQPGRRDGLKQAQDSQLRPDFHECRVIQRLKSAEMNS